MFELVLRIALAAACLGVALTGQNLPLDPAWRALAFFATYSILGYGLERRGLRNAGVSGLFAVADSGVILLLLASGKQLESYSFLALIPTAYAALRHNADAVAMAPIVAALLLFFSNLFGSPGWTPAIMIQSVGFLALGLLGAKRTKVLTVKEVVEVATEAPIDEHELQTVFDLREKFRVMRDHAKDVERKSRRDRLTVQLRESADESAPDALKALAKKLTEVLHVDGVALYTAEGDRFHPQVSSGSCPTAVRDMTLDFPDFVGEWQLKEKIALQLVGMGCQAANLALVVLKKSGRVTGLMAVFGSRKTELGRATEIGEEMAECVSRLLSSILGRQTQQQQLQQAEVLYAIAGTCQGAETPVNLVARASRALWEMSHLDHLSMCMINEDDLEIVTQHGASTNVREAVVLAGAADTDEWLRRGAPELYCQDLHASNGDLRTEAFKKRIGSLVVMPVGFGKKPAAVIVAYSHRSCGVTQETLRLLRTVALELGQALQRLEDSKVGPTGLATPREFHSAVQRADRGWLVHLEMLKRDEIIEQFGLPALDMATQSLASNLRRSLPPGAVMCRRNEGDFMVFLPNEEAEAQSWAANVTASASLIPVVKPGTQLKMPLALRSKVSFVAQQSDRISLREAKVASN